MNLSTRAGRHKQWTNSLNNSLKTRKSRRSLSIKKNIINEAGPTQKYKRKSSHIENSNSSKSLTVISLPTKQCKEKEMTLSSTPHRQQAEKLSSLRRKSGGKPLASKKNIVHEAGSQQKSKKKSVEKSTLNETLGAESVRRSLRKSIQNEKLKEPLEAESVDMSNKKSSMQRKNLNKTLKIIPFTSTPIKQCHVSVQRCINESLTTCNSRLKKQKNCDKTPISESLRYSPSCTLSVTLRPRRQTPCISETHTLESTKVFKKFAKKKKSVTKAVMNYKSFAGTATIDDLSIKAHKRKAKSEGYKVPAKNTLKRRRFVFNELNKANDDYEDDIYESQNFEIFKGICIDSDSDLSMLSIATPKLGVHVTPMIRKNTPVFRDCISPTEYAINRRVAEECQYRRRKNVSSASEKTPVPEKKKLEFSRVLAGVQQKEKTFQRIVEGETSELENSYFSDCSILSTRPNK